MATINFIKENKYIFNNSENQELWCKTQDLPAWKGHTPDMLEENYLLLCQYELIADEMMRYCIRKGNPSILPPNKELLELLQKRQEVTPAVKSSCLRKAISDDYFSTDSVGDPAPSLYRKKIRRLWIGLAKSIDSDVIGASTAYFVWNEGKTTIKVQCNCGHTVSEFPAKEVISNYFISNNIQVIEVIYE